MFTLLVDGNGPVATVTPEPTVFLEEVVSTVTEAGSSAVTNTMVKGTDWLSYWWVLLLAVLVVAAYLLLKKSKK